MKLQENKTKIVATVGPATSSKEKLRELIEAGVNVFRINFSHGSHEDHAPVIKYIHELNDELGTYTAILGDLQGPKLRIGEVENNGVELVEGSIFEFTNEKCMGTSERVYMSYKQFPYDVKVGDTVLIDDGKLNLEVIETNNNDSVKAKVIYGGTLSSKKGVNLPNTKISLPSLTEKDFIDVTFGLQHDIDWIALSFVRSAKDIESLKEVISFQSKFTKVIAKIEKPEAVADIDKIIQVADGVMVARGDLGVELPFSHVPLLQKKIVEKCILHAKPVIIATQMFESMIHNSTPTRAEVNDVANAVLDSATAVMLSAETSVGKYPVEVIKAMKKIVCYTEKEGYEYDREHDPEVMNETFIPDSICHAACKMVSKANASSIVVLTHSGYTAYRIASHRPEANIFAYTPNKPLARQMSLLWGVQPFHTPEFENTNDAVVHTYRHLKKNELIGYGEFMVHVGSLPRDKKGLANTLQLSQFRRLKKD